MSTLVGIFGASGSVGRAVVRRLSRSRPELALRLAVRRVRAADEPDTALAASQLVLADARDAASLASFCRDCTVVINCAGPSSRILDAVARPALAAGADYVDAGGDEALAALLRRDAACPAPRRCLLSAGLMPGLSGLLPRALAKGFESKRMLTAYLAVRDAISPAAAQDYVAGLFLDESLAGWRQGVRQARVAKRLSSIQLPLFADQVAAHPYLSVEAERVARDLKVESAQWYNVFEAEHVLNLLTRLAGAQSRNDTEAATALQSAAALDVAGRSPHQTFLFELSGRRGGHEVTESLLFRGLLASESTAAMATLSALAVLERRVPSGLHFAADVVEPSHVLEALRGDANFPICETFGGDLSSACQAEEGGL